MVVMFLAAIAAPTAAAEVEVSTAAAEVSEPAAVPAPAPSAAPIEETIAGAAEEVQSSSPAPEPAPAPAPEVSSDPAPVDVVESVGAASVDLSRGAAASLPSTSSEPSAISTTVERLSEPVRRTSAAVAVEGVTAAAVKSVVAPAVEGGETLDAIVASAAPSLPAIPTSPLGLDQPTSFEAPPNFIPAGIPASTAPQAGLPPGAGSAPTPLAAYSTRTHLDPIGAGLPSLAAMREARARSAVALVFTPGATGFHPGSLAGGDRSYPSSPAGPPPPPFQAPNTGAGSSGSFFIPLAALLALLALTAPATFRRRREAPESMAPVPFVCALERPG